MSNTPFALQVDPELIEALQKGAENIPTIPGIASQLVEALSNDELDRADFINIIEKDLAIVGKLIRAANSPLYKQVKEAVTIGEAISILGLVKSCNVALAIVLYRSLSRAYPRQLDIKYFWQRAVLSSVASKSLAKGQQYQDLAFLAGLLQDIGVFIMASAAEFRYMSAVGPFQTSHMTLMAAEKREFGCDHSVVGAFILESWNFPAKIVHAIACSHVTNKALDQLSSAVATSGWIADYLLGDPRSLDASDIVAKSVMQATSGGCLKIVDEAFAQVVAECREIGHTLTDDLFDSETTIAVQERLKIINTLWLRSDP